MLYRIKMPIKAITFVFLINIVLIFVSKSAKCAIREYNFPKSALPKYTLCETKECMELALEYQKTLDFSFEPCTNFYAFACGKIHEKIEDSRKDNRALGNLEEDNLYTLAELFASPEIETPRDVIETAQAFYQGCMKMENVPRKTIALEMNKLLKSFGGMPFLQATEYDPNVSWQRRAANIFRKLGSSIFADISVMPFPMDEENVYTISIYPYKSYEENGGSLFELSPKWRNGEKAYKQLMRESLCIMSDDQCSDGSKVDNVVEEIFNLETMLANLTSLPNYDKNGIIKASAVWNNLTNIQDKSLSSFLQEVINVFELTTEERNRIPISVVTEKYFGVLFGFLEKTDLRIISNYIGWRVFKVLPGMDTASLKKYLTEVTKVDIGIKELPPLKRKCAESTRSFFPLTTARLFVERFVPRGINEYAQEMVQLFKDVFISMIKNITWMDDKTKDVALKKMSNLKYQITYPKWIFNDSILEEKEGLLQPFNMNAIITSVVNSMTQRQTNMIKTLHQKPHVDSWNQNPTYTDASFDHTRNELILNLGLFRPPVYHHNTISAINYGSFGVLLAHELIHSLYQRDDLAYDEFGNQTIWWTNKTRDNFQSIMQCFVDMYNFTDLKTNLTMRSKKYLIEIIADSGGMEAAYQAYMLTNPKDERLPGLQNLSHEQLFFIAKAKFFCGRVRDEDRKMFLMDDDHPLDEYRAFIPQRNFKAFADAFGCPEGSPMNPKKKCHFW